MKNIQTAILPLSIVLCLCGLKVFEYPQGRPRLYLTIFYILISWLPYIYNIRGAKIFLDKFRIDFPMIVSTNIIFSVAYALLSLYHNKNCLNKLNIVNDTLENLGTPNNYAKLRIRIKWLIIGWVISIFSIDMFDSLWLIRRVPGSYIAMAIYMTFLLNYTLHINTLYELLFMTLLRYIGFRFEYINQHIQELTEQKKRKVRHAWATSTSPLIRRHMAGTETSKRIIWILMHVHLELCSISRELNTIFGLTMMMQTAALQIFLIQLTVQLYDSVMSTHSRHQVMIDVLVAVVWTTSNITKMIFFNYICEQICSKANGTEMFLNRMTNLIFDVETQENIMQFLLHLLRRPLKISANGFYNFGYNFVQQFMQTVASIIIVVIQFHP